MDDAVILGVDHHVADGQLVQAGGKPQLADEMAVLRVNEKTKLEIGPEVAEGPNVVSVTIRNREHEIIGRAEFIAKVAGTAFTQADERALQREIFVWRPSWPSMLVQVGRQLKAGWRYRRLHREMVRDLLK